MIKKKMDYEVSVIKIAFKKNKNHSASTGKTGKNGRQCKLTTSWVVDVQVEIIVFI